VRLTFIVVDGNLNTPHCKFGGSESVQFPQLIIGFVLDMDGAASI